MRHLVVLNMAKISANLGKNEKEKYTELYEKIEQHL